MRRHRLEREGGNLQGSFFLRSCTFRTILISLKKACSNLGMHVLWFNLATDLDDPILGFTSSWIGEVATIVDSIHVITMRLGRVELPENVRIYSVSRGTTAPNGPHVVWVLHQQNFEETSVARFTSVLAFVTCASEIWYMQFTSAMSTMTK